MRIFKYGSRHIPDVLANKEIRVSAANELNDPFELSPRIEASQFTLKRATQFLCLDHQIDEWYQKEGRRLGFTNKKKYKAHYLKTLEQRARSLLPNIPQNVEQARKDFAATFSRYWRLFCASRIHDSILMWSHYAAQHTGAVIEFDSSQPPFVHLDDKTCLSVQYSDQKVEFLFRPKRGESFPAALAPVVSSKATAWAYEQEVRFLFPTTFCREGHFAPVSPFAIRHVYFGARSTPEYCARIEALLRAPEYSHVGISKADLSPEAYTLQFHAVRDETRA